MPTGRDTQLLVKAVLSCSFEGGMHDRLAE